MKGSNNSSNKLLDSIVIGSFIIFTIIFLLLSWFLIQKNNDNFLNKYNNYFGQIGLNYDNQVSLEVKNDFKDVFHNVDHFFESVSFSTSSTDFDCSNSINALDAEEFYGWYLVDNNNNIVCESNFPNDVINLRQFDDNFFLKTDQNFLISKVFLLEIEASNVKNVNVFKIYKSYFDDKKNKQVTVVLLVDLDNFILTHLKDNSLWFGSEFFVLDSKGDIFWTADNDLIGKSIEDDYVKKVYVGFGDALNILQKARLGKTGFQTYSFRGNTYITSYTKSQILPDYYWGILVNTPEKYIQSGVFANYIQGSYTFFYFVAFLLIAFLLSLYFVFRKNIFLHLQIDETKKEMIEETKKFKITEVKLNKTVEELESLNSNMVNRELKMIELKEEIKKVKENKEKT